MKEKGNNVLAPTDSVLLSSRTGFPWLSFESKRDAFETSSDRCFSNCVRYVSSFYQVSFIIFLLLFYFILIIFPSFSFFFALVKVSVSGIRPFYGRQTAYKGSHTSCTPLSPDNFARSINFLWLRSSHSRRLYLQRYTRRSYNLMNWQWLTSRDETRSALSSSCSPRWLHLIASAIPV